MQLLQAFKQNDKPKQRVFAVNMLERIQESALVMRQSSSFREINGAHIEVY